MKGTPKVGVVGEQRFVVEARHAIDFANSTMPAVLFTPWLIWFHKVRVIREDRIAARVRAKPPAKGV